MDFLTTHTNYTDPQGQLWAAPVFGISYATENTNQNAGVALDFEDMLTLTETISKNRNVNVRFFYWPSQETKDTGYAPYILANVLTMSFDFNASGVEYENLTLKEACFYYLQNTILA